MEKDRIEMSQHERDVLKVMSLVLKGDRTQVEAARLLKRSVRQVRRIQRRLERDGDGAVVHKLRGQPSNRRVPPPVSKSALALYRAKYMGFGPTLAAEKLAEDDKVKVKVRTLREWLLNEGLWTRKRRRDRHRSRQVRRSEAVKVTSIISRCLPRFLRPAAGVEGVLQPDPCGDLHRPRLVARGPASLEADVQPLALCM